MHNCFHYRKINMHWLSLNLLNPKIHSKGELCILLYWFKLHLYHFKVHRKRNFLLDYSKELSKWWRRHCDRTLDCGVTQDFDLCKLDDYNVDTKWCQITKNWISLQTPGPLHSKSKLRVFLLQEVLLALVVQSVSVSKYAAQAQESPLNSGATNRGFFVLGW